MSENELADRIAAIDLIYDTAKQSVKAMWNHPRELVGPVLYRTLVAEELLRVLAVQAKMGARDSTVRELVRELWERLLADPELGGPA